MGLKLQHAVGRSALNQLSKPVALVYALFLDDPDSSHPDGWTRLPVSAEKVAAYLGRTAAYVRHHRKLLIADGILKAETEIVNGRMHVRVVGFVPDNLPRNHGCGVTSDPRNHGCVDAQPPLRGKTEAAKRPTRGRATTVAQRTSVQPTGTRQPQRENRALSRETFSSDDPCPICGGPAEELKFKPVPGTQPKCNACHFRLKGQRRMAANVEAVVRATMPLVVIPEDVPEPEEAL